MPLTYLFVPANEPRKTARAIESGADAVIFDLEAAVPGSEKEAARRAIREQLALTRLRGGPELWVRVNAPGPEFDADLRAIDWDQVDGVVVAQAENPEPVRLLQNAGARSVLPLIETARGFRTLENLAQMDAVTRFGIGTWDLVVDLGLIAVADPDDSELIWQLRGQLVVVSRQLGLAPPIDGVYARLDDEIGLRAICERAYRLGYGGKLLVHPRQIPVAKAVFEPTEDRLQVARAIIDAFEHAALSGIGVIRVGERMIDRPMVEQARALLARRQEPS
jgi:citrate lyase subunit beta/citryl-CoA lyase